ncbi:hypothetical protein [Streptomyces violaceus]|uniref:Uncharacterized protein n=1 Tax=Streptomyces violaceus TaxID=1936 RepID=A0ABY9TZY7_STRVL|nr:hypothetical protein [Streptomyces janthinus]WND15910.1 hypothetical protein RI060_00350 [Streptomyces janthinus]GGS98618.1 hypothetical protein GCM10010270_83270 [Streptomyces janthinus]
MRGCSGAARRFGWSRRPALRFAVAATPPRPPKSPRLEAYQRLLKGWAAEYPTLGTPAAPAAPATAPQPVTPEAFTGPPERPAARLTTD